MQCSMEVDRFHCESEDHVVEQALEQAQINNIGVSDSSIAKGGSYASMVEVTSEEMASSDTNEFHSN
ncbi:Hypothetical predicted protein [Octopus vulgaris]|uniref:Uncharacterized protein n=1 Tax=Octopus vulgaris TaxID=6645 RepID=A0AA36AIE4_OCTVU|nr:Hypothetical predicted protein [Octopus vulgaris]